MLSADNLRNLDLNTIAEIMTDQAAKHGILGAAVIGIYHLIQDPKTGEVKGVAGLSSGQYATLFNRPPQPNYPMYGPDDRGTNFLGSAHSKQARRLRLEIGQDTTQPPIRSGENPASGDEALWFNNHIIAVAAFSGPVESKKNSQVAQLGIALLLELHTTSDNFPERMDWFKNHPHPNFE